MSANTFKALQRGALASLLLVAVAACSAGGSTAAPNVADARAVLLGNPQGNALPW